MGIGKRDSYVREGFGREGPGPGAYSLLSRAVEGPRYGFGSEARAKTKGDGGPGPGAYRLPVKVAGVPRYAMPNQKEEYKWV